jgi:hypothetical protein
MSVKYDNKGKNYRARKTSIDSDDYFPTYHALTRLLLDKLKFNKKDIFLEPCAGNSDITKILMEYGYEIVMEIDINPKNENIIKDDFLNNEYTFVYPDHIITNPPFKLSVEFFIKSCDIAKKNICMLWPLDYLHGVKRFDIMYKNGLNGFKLKTCYAFVRRPLFDPKYRPDGPMPTGSTSFAWFHFEKGYNGKPVIEWLHNNDELGTPIEIEQIMFSDLKMNKKTVN